MESTSDKKIMMHLKVILALLIVSVSEGIPAMATPQTLTIGIYQRATEASLEQNRDGIIRGIATAAAQGCRVLVVPEGSLSGPPETRKLEIDKAVDMICRASSVSHIYVVLGLSYHLSDSEDPHQRLIVINPDGTVIHVYDKIWYDPRFDPPKVFKIDGIPCGAILCADRWARPVEELTALESAQILFELSGNFRNEWISDLGWYWYVPRAKRNNVFVVFANIPRNAPGAQADCGPMHFGHGHSAIVSPDGNILASTGDQAEQLVIAKLDISKATRAEDAKRRQHPLFKTFWEAGIALLNGRTVSSIKYEPVTSAGGLVRVAAAQLACSRSIADNVVRMRRMIHTAKQEGADVVVFPELAITGRGTAEIKQANQATLQAAVVELQATARAEGITLIFGTPWFHGDHRVNSAFAFGPDGTLLTRYDQLATDRPELFDAGHSTRAMWFQVNGNWSVVTIGQDGLWSEIAELAAWRGAVMHFHLANVTGELAIGGDKRGLRMDTIRMDVDGEGWARQTPIEPGMARRQQWAVMATCSLLTVTVNAAHPVSIMDPGDLAEGGSAIWQDFTNASYGMEGGYAPHSAVRIAEAGSGEEIIYAEWILPTTNKQVPMLLNSLPRWET
jgi:predicted amidohydrolase